MERNVDDIRLHIKQLETKLEEKISSIENYELEFDRGIKRNARDKTDYMLLM